MAALLRQCGFELEADLVELFDAFFDVFNSRVWISLSDYFSHILIRLFSDLYKNISVEYYSP